MLYEVITAFDWLKDISDVSEYREFIEVQFKNTRKGFYHNANGLRLNKGDVVAVEASPGHDMGRVVLTGQLALTKMLNEGINPKQTELKKVYRKAKPADIIKWDEAIELEDATMLRSRKIAEKLNLDMKIGDVEYVITSYSIHYTKLYEWRIMRRCMGCMEEIDDSLDECINCGYIRNTPPKEAYHMPPESILGERYIVGRVLGYGGFGVTYLGYDAVITSYSIHYTKLYE